MNNVFPCIKKTTLTIHNNPKINDWDTNKYMLRGELRLAVFYVEQWFSCRLTELLPVQHIQEMRINSIGLAG